MENRFYIDSDVHLSTNQIKMIKSNNRFVINVLANLFNHKGTKLLPPVVLQNIYAKKLIYTDKVTNYNTNRLGEKLLYLVQQCETSENKDKVFNSYFAGIVLAFCAGEIEGGDGWKKYVLTSNCENVFKNDNALNIALAIYNDDINVPIGLNLTALIDTIVQTDENGKFSIEDTTNFTDKENMTESLIMFLQSIKNSERFKKNLFIPNQDEDNPHNKDSH